MRKPYIMYHQLEDVQALGTHGQSWRGDSVRESIELCRHRFIEPVFRRYLPADGKILEAGCGVGNWVFYLRGLGYDVVGIELEREAIRLAKEHDSGAPILAADVLATGFPDGHFGAVISLGVVEHFEDGPGAAFREIRRILRNDGVLLIAVPIQNLSRRLLANRLKELKRWLMKRRGVRYAFEEYRYTPAEFTALLKDAGFDIVECVPDEYALPRSNGLFVDYPFLRNGSTKWELNGIGSALARAANAWSPWWVSGGALWVCRKGKGGA